MSLSRRLLLPLLLVLCGCSRPAARASEPASTRRTAEQPYVLLLGTAQDAGLPQIGCRQQRCLLAATRRRHRRLVTSLLLCDPRSGKRWLFDATPDLREQVHRAHGHPATRRQPAGGRPPLFEGIFLTHAHIGHYTGLMFLGRESYGAKLMPVHASPQMASYLRDNGPWSQLVAQQQIKLRPFELDTPVVLADDLRVTAFVVPHRDEFSDTVGFVISGPERKLMYLPDIDKWERWKRPIEQAVAGVDVALLDGTFYADGEIPGRSMRDIPHPFIVESMRRLGKLPLAERRKVLFTHLNHTNPAADANSAAARAVTGAGMGVAQDGQIIPL